MNEFECSDEKTDNNKEYGQMINASDYVSSYRIPHTITIATEMMDPVN